MKERFYFWLTQLSYKMICYHSKKFNKWCAEYSKWTEVWKKSLPEEGEQ